MAPGGFVLSSFSLTSGDIVKAIEGWGDSAATPISAAMERTLGIRNLCFDAQRPVARRVLASVLARHLRLVLGMNLPMNNVNS
jgi:hypothetical protein